MKMGTLSAAPVMPAGELLPNQSSVSPPILPLPLDAEQVSESQ
jgi:hypothetical protein